MTFLLEEVQRIPNEMKTCFSTINLKTGRYLNDDNAVTANKELPFQPLWVRPQRNLTTLCLYT